MYQPHLESLELTFWRMVNSILNRWVKARQKFMTVSSSGLRAVKEFDRMLEKGWDLKLILVSLSLGGISFMLGFVAGLLFG